MKDLPLLLEKIARRRLLVIGDIMLDHYQWGDATRISPEAPVPVVHISHETDTIGGAANVAHNVAALGAAVELVGVVGDDDNGRKLRGRFREKRISFDDAFIGRGTKTITKTRVIVRNQQLCRLDHEDAPRLYRAMLGPDNLARIEAKIAAADGVIISDYAKGVVTTELVRRVAALARKHGKLVALDPKPANGIEFSDLDLVTPNRREAIELSGLQFGADEAVDLPKLCAALRAKYTPRNLVVTLGGDGMLIDGGDGRIETIPTAARQVYDVSGAGDTVIAALSLALSAGSSLEEAAHFANAAAGVVVGKLGTATVTPQELIAYVG